MPQAGHIAASKIPYCLLGETMEFSKPSTREELVGAVPDNHGPR